ncbi:chemotaxis protein CheA [Williamwhitmania taraxaci]|uniref:Chemotaxis protein CheA n=1 Tax=Williamwhitmania taraxaci TaxID=1640674 RepID=A0A1G6Q129_9BACT|nr:chemotaxis protein CheA [Williamwhitmania taraxaci]SDC86063.1 CheA signal transduction histidine kinase [Williamwhitmania taraxaci]
MDNFKKKFIEEAIDLINSLEKALLTLEDNPEDSSIIQQVFRIMHTLKGNSSMFGFTKMDQFTHELETLYDNIRNGKVKVNRAILDVTLDSVDHLKVLLEEDTDNSVETLAHHTELLGRIATLISSSPLQTEKIALPEKKKEIAGGIHTYYIYFEPNEDIFQNGTNPLYLIDELHSLGQAKAFAHLNRVPSFDTIKREVCYAYWEVILSTSHDVNAISDVFIFVEDECILDISQIADKNLLADDLFVAEITRISDEQNDIGIAEVQRLASKVKTIQIKDDLANVIRGKAKTKEALISSIRVSADKLDQLMNLVSELVTTQARLTLFSEQNSVPGLPAIAENVQKLSRQLRDNAFSIVLIPIENMLTRFQRLVRDLSKELGKDVVFLAEGAETELDKTIVEGLTDPLMHILRNSLDHGIEDAELRQKLGKPKQGKIVLKAFYSGANVHIQIHDDGAGIDLEMIRQKALSLNLISPDKKLTPKEIYDLIFLPGFTTAKKVTDVSGRGVGMDVVRRKIADIRGEVEIDSEVGVGTTITIKLPLTLSIIDGLLVSINEVFYVIPLTVVDKIFAVDHHALVDTFNNVIVLDGVQVPFFYLRKEFGEPINDVSHEEVVVVKYEEKRVGLAVDSVIGEYQAVLKPLGRYFKAQEMISGATILGDGTVALVMDTNKMIKSFLSSLDE